MAYNQLKEAGVEVIAPSDQLPGDLEYVFRNAWTDNGDAISIIYTGTKATKTDITRHGRRTAFGAATDMLTIAKRLYINNFADGDACDCLDVATHKLRASEQAIRSPITLMKLLIVLCILFGIIVSWLIRFTARIESTWALSSAISVACWTYAVKYGRKHLVNSPTLPD